eukprot:768749-Hanusia_phi.AAC.17
MQAAGAAQKDRNFDGNCFEIKQEIRNDKHVVGQSFPCTREQRGEDVERRVEEKEVGEEACRTFEGGYNNARSSRAECYGQSACLAQDSRKAADTTLLAVH